MKQLANLKRWQKIVLAVFWAGVCYLVFVIVDPAKHTAKINNPQPQPANETVMAPPLKIMAATLAKDYDKNEVSADRLYHSKPVILTGKIINIGLDIRDKPYIIVRGSGNTDIQCVFLSKGDVAVLNKGENVKLMGNVAGLMGDIILENCQTYIPWQ